MQGDEHLVALFKVHTVKNEGESAKKGRPIFDDMEVVEIRAPGDRLRVGVYPAHSFSHWEVDNETGEQSEKTYAERFNKQYRAFKEKRQQVQSGTPLEEAPFLTQAKRLELRAFSIYTVEQLAAMDGQPLKSLGMGGRELKNQAQAYLDAATGSADVTRLAAEVESLKAQLAEARSGATPVAPVVAPVKSSDFDDWTDEDIKVWIKDRTGSAPRGNPSHDTLVRMAEEIATAPDEAAA